MRTLAPQDISVLIVEDEGLVALEAKGQFEEIVAGRADVMVTDGIEVDHQAAMHKGVLCPAAVPAPFTRLEKAYWVRRDADLDRLVGAWLDQEIDSGSWKRTLDAALEAP